MRMRSHSLRAKIPVALLIGAIMIVAIVCTTTVTLADQTCASGGSSNGGDGTCASPTSQSQKPHCNLYMAESTIPGAGIGIFSGIPKEVGDKIGHGDVCIPFVDLYWHNPSQADSADRTNPFVDYFWTGHAMGMATDSARDDIEALCPGLDCAVNCHLALVNTEKAVPFFDEADLHRDESPGVGAFTPYHNGSSVATRAIPAGGELFKYYGDHWFVHRQDIFGNIPLTTDYDFAQELLESMVQLDALQSTTKKKKSSSATLAKDLYETVVLGMQSTYDSRTLNALPATMADVHTAVDAGELAAVLQPVHTRTPDWLQDHGTCIDHIRPGMSTIPDAGHGGFATRDLPAGTVITVSPVHHLHQYSFLNVYNLTQGENDVDKTSWLRMIDEVVGQQLAFNYCMGVEDSTVLLCPYGSGVNYLNHNQTRRNVRLDWATGEDHAYMHDHALVETGTVSDLARSSKPRLAMQYVATQDIAAGEELFLDYGTEWEDAWWYHVENYVPASTPTKYVSAHAYNFEFASTPLRTHRQQLVDPYPSNLQLRCERGLLLRQPLVDQDSDEDASYVWQPAQIGVPCRIMDSFVHENQVLYTITLEWDPNDDEDPDQVRRELGRMDPSYRYHQEGVVWVGRTDVPRHAIRFFDVAYTSDIHQHGSIFRREMGVPSDMFPDLWRNL